METWLPLSVSAITIVVFCACYAFVAGLRRRAYCSQMDTLLQTLPGLDCGACGYPLCRDYAAALANHEAGPMACVPGGPSVAYALGDRIGVAPDVGEPMMASVHCQGGKSASPDRVRYEGIADCHAALLISDAVKPCYEGCLGLGSCVPSCPLGAISMNDDGVAIVNRHRCTGCGKCLDSCPRSLISLIPHVHKIYLACANHDGGERVTSYCTAGCTGCEECARITTTGAITMENNLPRLDYYTPSENFVAASYACPSKCFIDLIKARPKANIDTKCDGCGECIRVCPVGEVITGQPGKRHVVHKEKCIGCGRCLNSCHVRAISLWGSLGYESGYKAGK
jgi:Na+-translocating ferredoxin:NAD+ oxidoreductase subunit B